MIKNDRICWITNEGSEWLTETVDNLTVEFVKDYVDRTRILADQLVDSWQRNGEEDATLSIYFYLEHQNFNKFVMINKLLSDMGL